MKGIVFTEFFEMVEQTFGYEMVDTLINTTELESGGVYTSIGTYHHSEIVALVQNLSKQSGMDIDALLHAFGRYLFDTFLKAYPIFFDKASNSFEFLASIDNYIHVEVQKLYPDATLPRFSTQIEDGKMIMIYKSERSMSALALGLIEKTLEYYGEEVKVSKEVLTEDGTEVKFVIG
ncbi:MAG: heme NO-binding domain-containing protein [Bacteroidota bacterium]